MDFLTEAKNSTHYLVGLLILGAGWVIAHPQTVSTWPKASVITAAAGLVWAIYRKP